MRRLAVLPLLGLAALAAVPSSASTADGNRCNPRGSRTVDATRSVRVYKRGYDLFACGYRTGKAVSLGEHLRLPCDSPSACWDGTGLLDIAGRWVGTKQNLHSLEGAGGQGRSEVWLTDTVTGRRTPIYNSSTVADAPPHHSADTLTATVTASGRMAFIVEFYGAPGTTRELLFVGATRGVVADSGAGIDASSLAIAGRTVYWKHDGQVHSADLPD